MKLKIYSIYDNKAQAFLPLFQVRADGEALRQFKELANNKQTNISKYPEDFALMEMGTFDDAHGKINALSAPKNLGLASEFVDHTAPIGEGETLVTDFKKKVEEKYGKEEAEKIK
jgi:hypothetical protein